MGNNIRLSTDQTKAEEWNLRQAKREKTGGKIASGLGYGLSWIPYVGPFLAVAGQAIKAGLDASAGAKMKRAAVLKESQARQIQARPIAAEFIQAQKAAQMQALGGIGGYEKYKQGIQQSQAQQLNAIKNTATSGDAALVAASNALAQTNMENQKLAAADLQFRQGANENVIKQLNEIGLQKKLKQDEQMAQINLASKAAGAFANAGQALQLSAINTGTNAIGNLGSTIMNTAQSIKDKKEEDTGSVFSEKDLQRTSDRNYMASERQDAYDKPIGKEKFAPEESWMYDSDHLSWTEDQKKNVSKKLNELNKNPFDNQQEIEYLRFKLDDINAAKNSGSAI